MAARPIRSWAGWTTPPTRSARPSASRRFRASPAAPGGSGRPASASSASERCASGPRPRTRARRRARGSASSSSRLASRCSGTPAAARTSRRRSPSLRSGRRDAATRSRASSSSTSSPSSSAPASASWRRRASAPGAPIRTAVSTERRPTRWSVTRIVAGSAQCRSSSSSTPSSPRACSTMRAAAASSVGVVDLARGVQERQVGPVGEALQADPEARARAELVAHRSEQRRLADARHPRHRERAPPTDRVTQPGELALTSEAEHPTAPPSTFRRTVQRSADTRAIWRESRIDRRGVTRYGQAPAGCDGPAGIPLPPVDRLAALRREAPGRDARDRDVARRPGR